MKLDGIEKSLKRFLKKKVTYSLSLLVAFLITGEVSVQGEIIVTSKQLESSRESILRKINLEKMKIKRKLAANEAKIKQLQSDDLELLKEADWWAKTNPLAVSVSFIGGKTTVDGKSKHYVKSTRTNTDMDKLRIKFDNIQPENPKGSNRSLLEAIQYKKDNGGEGSSGWITATDGYNKNTNSYDFETDLMILPVVKAPQIMRPTVPNVSFKTPVAPTKLSIQAPSGLGINVGNVSVQAPIVTGPTIATPPVVTAPSTVAVNVNPPVGGISVGSLNVAGPGILNVPTLSVPTVNLVLNPMAPARITPPNPQIGTPKAPNAPNFTRYVAPGGWWYGGWTAMRGINEFDSGRYFAMANAVASLPFAHELQRGEIRRETDTAFPILSNIKTLQNGKNGARGTVYAYREGTVSADPKVSDPTPGAGHTGYKNIVSQDTYNATTTVYHPANNGGASIPIPGSKSINGYTANTVIPDREIAQKNRWVLTAHKWGGPTKYENIDFIIGGPDGKPTENPGALANPATEAKKVPESGVVLMRNDGDVTFANSTVEMKGKSTFTLDILYGEGYDSSITLDGVKINITGNQNTVFHNPAYQDKGAWGSIDLITKNNADWGKPQKNIETGKKGIVGKLDLSINTATNTIYNLGFVDSYRWKGQEYSIQMLSDGTKAVKSNITNPEAFLVYGPAMGRVKYLNRDIHNINNKGNLYFNGTNNVGAWISKYVPDRTQYDPSYYPSAMPADQAPIIDMGKLHMTGDNNVGIYFQSDTNRPDANGIYMGKVPVDFEMGVTLNDKSTTAQLAAGNKDGNDKISSGNVALYVASGQRPELTVANGYFPATTDLVTHAATQKYSTGLGAGVQIGFPELNTAKHKIQNLKIDEYNVNFGKYSKDNIAVVSRNGSVVELMPNHKITDGQSATTPDSDRATGTIIAYAEGVWYNPRLSKDRVLPNDGSAHLIDTKTDASGNLSFAKVEPSKAVLGKGETPGQKFVPQYGSAILIKQDLELGSKQAIAAYAKDGAKIESKNITIYGKDSTGVFASGNKVWLDETKLEDDITKGGLKKGTAKTSAPTVINVNGDINIKDGRGAIAISDNGSNKTGDGAKINITGSIKVGGLGAYVDGANSSITIAGSQSDITSGVKDGTLVAKHQGTLSFGGGKLNHNRAGQVAFYAEKENGKTAKIDFKGATTLNIGSGIAFYGDKTDFSATTVKPGETGRYTNMNNLTVNLAGDGVDLGVFKDIDVDWDGNSSTYMAGLKNMVHATIKDNGHWYKSSLDGGKLNIKTNVDLDKSRAYSTSAPYDLFNDITMERKQVILDPGKVVSSVAGHGLMIGSNTSAHSNLESGYEIKGKVNISGGNPSVGTYVSYGHINVANGGTVQVDNGVGAYGVNGSKLENYGNITIGNSSAAKQSVGILSLATNIPGTALDKYGKNNGASGLWGEVLNDGNITVTGNKSIGIYVDNNKNGLHNTDMKIQNNGVIQVGDDSTGIAIKGNGAELSLKGKGANKDINVGKNGIGIYSENTNTTFNTDYGIVLKDGGIALETSGNGNIASAGKTLTVGYIGASGVGKSAIGIASNTGNLNNSLNLKMNNVGNAETLVGLYGVNSSINNSGDITSNYNGSYGIIAKGGNINNVGTVKVGTVSTATDAIGIYGENASIITEGGKIEVLGDGGNNSSGKLLRPVGIYAKNTGLSNTSITINKNTVAPKDMKISGKYGIGEYVEDKNGKINFTNNSDITLLDSSNTNERKYGIFMSNASNSANKNTGKIDVGVNDIGIYAKDSLLTNTGIIDIKNNLLGDTIGVYNLASNGNFNFINTGNINVEGLKDVGIFGETKNGKSGIIDINTSNISVTAINRSLGNTPIGVYGKGSNLLVKSASNSNITANANAVGIYLDGDRTSKTIGNFTYNLSSDKASKTMGIGVYYKGGTYGDAGLVTVKSLDTQYVNATDLIRPIGLFYGVGSTQNKSDIKLDMVGLASGKNNDVIGMYGTTLGNFTNSGNIIVGNSNTEKDGIGGYFKDTNITNTGNVVVNTNKGYGLYLNGGNSKTNATIDANGMNSVGVILEGSTSKLINNGIINSNAVGSTGVYVEKGEFINNKDINSKKSATGRIAGSTGIFVKNGKVKNKGNMSVDYMGIYGITGSTIDNEGLIKLQTGEAIHIADSASKVNLLTNGKITGTNSNLIAVRAEKGAKVDLNGTKIELGKSGIGLSLDKSTATLVTGDISVGDNGTAIYTRNSNVNLGSYGGTISLGNKGIGIYSENSNLSNGKINLNYSGIDKGVGIYYTGNTPVINNIQINHNTGGKNLVNLYTKGVDLTNNSNQNILENGIGIYADNNGKIKNNATISLNGKNGTGLFVNNGEILSIGDIKGTPLTSIADNKVGVYVENGDIKGNLAYNFDIDGGVGIYLKNNAINYTGTMKVVGDSIDIPGKGIKRTIGEYISPGIVGHVKNNIEVTGKDAVGLYLAEENTALPSVIPGANMTLDGNLKITSASTSIGRGIGAMLEKGSILNLGNNSTITIGGQNNIGFYVKKGANLNANSGTIHNTKDGIVAYLEGGTFNIGRTSTLSADYMNVIVDGSTGSIKNDSTVTVGTKGLQVNNGAIGINSLTGNIKGTVIDAKGMVATGSGSKLTNNGKINLSGDKSVGIYVEKGAVGNSTGDVKVGNKSVAYYAEKGGTLNVSGTSSTGQNSTLFMATGGNINYTGGNIVVSPKSIGLSISDIASVVNFNGKDISVGSNGTGIYVSGTGTFSNVNNIGKVLVDPQAIGIYLDNSSLFNGNVDITLKGDSIGIFTKNNGNINYNGSLNSTLANSKGIINIGTGTTTNKGLIKLLGSESIGIYGENGNIKNIGNIEIGDGRKVGTTLNSSVAIYGKNVSKIDNIGKITFGKEAVGIYGENTVISNTGDIKSTKNQNTGIYAVNTNISNTGNIELKNNANAIYVKNGNIKNSGNITVGSNNSVGLYGAGNTSISHDSGMIKVEDNSTGIASETGNIIVKSGAHISGGKNSTYVYTEVGKAINNENLQLGDYSVGMYTKSGVMENNANISLGKSSITSTNRKISVGMATEKGNIENKGTINIKYDNGVGMVANNGGYAKNSGTIDVIGNGAYGMQATNKSIIENTGHINVKGTKSRGMAATQYSTVLNKGTIDVKGSKAEGIYVDYGAKIDNNGGTINVNSNDGTGIYVGSGGQLINKGKINVVPGATATINGSGTIRNIGDIVINGPKASIDGVTITNTGTITVNGALDFGKIKLGSTVGHIGTINAKSFNDGKFLVLPNATQGSNHLMYTVQYLKGVTNVPHGGSIKAISHSVSYIADLQKDTKDPNLVRVVMVKVPYEKLLQNTPAVEFGKGLDQIYEKSVDKELQMFDSIDMISDKDELGETFDNELRGNVYANIQSRMSDIQDVFDISYDNLKSSPLYAREQLKIGTIIREGEFKDKNPGVVNYDSKTKGFMLLKEYDLKKYGKMVNWDIGFTETKFDFDENSEEKVHSLHVGIGYEDFLKGNRWKYYTRGEFSLNHHETTRNITLSSGEYENKGKYWSALGMWKNKLRYEFPTSTEKLTGGVFGTFNAGYGRYEDFKESGDGIRLDLKSRDMYIVRPGVGADVSLNRYTKVGKFSLTGKATAERELGKVYDGANKAKIKDTNAGYYDLEKPEKVKNIYKIGAELKYKTRGESSIGFDIQREEGSVKGTTYGVNFQYKF